MGTMTSPICRAAVLLALVASAAGTPAHAPADADQAPLAARGETAAATVTCSNGHANVSAGKARGVSLGSTLLVADYQGRKAPSLFHVFEHPLKPLKDRRQEGLYLSVSPSSISIAPGAARDGFVVTLHDEDGSTETVEPSRVFAYQPDRVSFSGGTATAHQPGPAAISFRYQLPPKQRAELQAVCYISVVTD